MRVFAWCYYAQTCLVSMVIGGRSRPTTGMFQRWPSVTECCSFESSFWGLWCSKGAESGNIHSTSCRAAIWWSWWQSGYTTRSQAGQNPIPHKQTCPQSSHNNLTKSMCQSNIAFSVKKKPLLIAMIQMLPPGYIPPVLNPLAWSICMPLVKSVCNFNINWDTLQ